MGSRIAGAADKTFAQFAAQPSIGPSLSSIKHIDKHWEVNFY